MRIGLVEAKGFDTMTASVLEVRLERYNQDVGFAETSDVRFAADLWDESNRCRYELVRIESYWKPRGKPRSASNPFSLFLRFWIFYAA